MSGISKTDVHVDTALTNLSVQYKPELSGLIAEQAVRVLNVAKESDKYFIWDRPTAFRVPTDLRADGAEANEVDHALTTASYACDEYALKTHVTDRQKDNADSILKLRENKMRHVQNLELIAQEQRVATLLTTQGNYASGNYTTLSGVGQWNNASFSGSIEETIDTYKEAIRQKIGMYPNTVIIPAAVAQVVKRDASIRELIKYTQSDLLVNGDLPPTMWNMKVLIPKGISTTSMIGASSVVMGDIWGKDVILTYVPPEGSIDTPAHAYILRAKNFMVRSWREESRNTEWIEVSVIQDEVVTSNISGALIQDVIA